MARNSEKAQSMLFRFRAAEAASLGIIDAGRTKRPRATASIDSIPTCEKWRGQVLKEISRKTTKIQDISLSDYQLRDLNDEINKLMKEKWAWEKQIRNLGGPNYMRGPAGMVDDEGREIPGTAGGGRGYRYYGRAKELPGVKEMLDAQVQRAREEREGAKDQRGVNEMARKHVDAAYYGWNRDEEDGELLKYEKRKEAEAIENLREQEGEDEASDPEWIEIPGDKGDGVRWEVPTAEEVQEELMERKRRRLLDKLG